MHVRKRQRHPAVANRSAATRHADGGTPAREIGFAENVAGNLARSPSLQHFSHALPISELRQFAWKGIELLNSVTEAVVKRLFCALTISVFLIPLTVSPVRADDHDQRYYDREYHTYHVWNTNEDRAYHHYWEEQHHAFREWKRLNDQERAAYWHWRHEHPDRDHR